MKTTFKLLLAGALACAATLSHAAPSAADQARAEELVSGRCFLCHGTAGESSSSMFPRLAGQHANYIAKQLADFQSGRRKSETMGSMVTDLTTADMAALGAYFEAMKPEAQKPSDVDLAGVGRYIFVKGNAFSGVPACQSCHGAKGHGTSALPRLASQQALYTEAQLRSFNKRERTNDNSIMHSIASKLTELEIKAVSEYISTLE